MAQNPSPLSRPFDAQWLEHAPLAMGVIREGVLVYANSMLADLLGGPRERIEGSPVFDFVVIEDRERVRERHSRRLRGDPVPDCYEFTALRLDGQTRLVEIFVGAGERHGEVVFQLADRTSRHERSRHLHALARLGASVQMKQSDEAVLAALGEGLTELGMSWARLAPDGDGLRIVALSGPADAIETVEKATGRSMVGAVGQWLPGVLQAWSDGASYLDDVPLAAARFFSDRSSKLVGDLAHEHGLMRGAALRIDAGGARAELLFVMASWILPDDLPAFALFATQVTAALDAARVIGDLSNRNAELAALNRIASAAGSERDLTSLFKVSSEELVRVLGCVTLVVYLVDEVQKNAVMVFEHNAGPTTHRKFGKMPLEGTRMGDVLRAGKPAIWTVDAVNENPAARGSLEAQGLTCVATVPLIARSTPIGLVAASFTRKAGERELNIMEATAAYFAPAVEANRLLESLRTSNATLARSQQQLVHRERLAAIGELAAVVAHEVRNPLGVIFNSVGAIRRMLKEVPEARTIVDILDEEANRLNHIVGDLLDFARPATPSLHVERVESILDAAAEAALGESKPDVVVERSYEASLPAVRIDARLMRQAFLNIVLNAVQAMPQGGRLTLRLAADGRGIKVEIGDTGSGIPEDVKPRIFEPFFTTRATGTGLGLAVVKRIIDGHRGEIGVVTDPRKGTAFTVRLPADPDEPDSQRSPHL